MRIDGAKEFRIFNTIIMPIMKPAVATQAIFRCIGLVFGKKLCYTVRRYKPRKTRS